MLYKKIKSIIKQYLLRKKFSRKNDIQRWVTFSADLKIGKGCVIGAHSIIGRQVVIGNNVQIGRYAFLEKISIDKNSTIELGVICTGYGQGRIQIGRESYIGIRNILDWSDDITIGNFVHIAGSSTGLWTHSSSQMCLNDILLDDKDKKYRSTSPIIIDDNVYVGGNCTIYPGVTIHHHSIIIPNTAVTKDVESYTLVGGVPAKIIKKL